jgi:type IX secretion system PorP/SprF family membrane protein
MKKIITIIIGIISGASLFAQQMPISENYFLDKYSLSPSYAGNFNNKYLFMGYRSDWSGVDGGPKTLRLSYNDSYKQNMGYGGRFIYDKAGIFKQTILLGTYSYKVLIAEKHVIMFGLSAGFYSNTLNLRDYYNDPKYNLDPALVSANVTSKLKFMSDFSAVYAFKGIEAGILFSNINFGDSKYQDVAVHYKPLANYQIHLSYLYSFSEKWDVSPIMLLRGGKYIKSQFEFASQVVYQKKVWGSLMFRDPGIWGIGIGASINKGLKIGYNFNIASSAAPRYFNNHEITLGINIFELTRSKNESVPSKGDQFSIAQ